MVPNQEPRRAARAFFISPDKMDYRQEATQSLKQWKSEGVVEIPRPLLELCGEFVAAQFLNVIISGIAKTTNPDGLFFISDKDFCKILCLDYEPFRHLRRKMETAGLVKHEIRRAEGRTCPHYSADFQAIREELERVRAGGFPRLVRYRHTNRQSSHSLESKGVAESSQTQTPQSSQSGQFSHSLESKPLTEFSQSQPPQPPNFHTPNIIKDLPNLHSPEFSQTITSPVNTSVPESLAVKTWRDVMGIELPPGAAELINASIDNRDGEALRVWRLTLLGWKSNPRWNNSNVSGQISRFTKSLRDGDFGKAPVPEKTTQPPDESRERDRHLVYRED